MEVQLGKEGADLGGPPREQGQDPALEPLLEAPDPRPTNRHRPTGQGQASRLPVAVAVAHGRIHRRSPGALHPAQKARYFFVQHRLQHPLNLLPGKRLQRLERHGCGRLGRRGLLSHGSVSFRTGTAPVGPCIDPGRLRCLHPISTPCEGTSKDLVAALRGSDVVKRPCTHGSVGVECRPCIEGPVQPIPRARRARATTTTWTSLDPSLGSADPACRYDLTASSNPQEVTHADGSQVPS